MVDTLITAGQVAGFILVVGLLLDLLPAWITDRGPEP